MEKILNIPFFEQRINFCGPACLSMVFGYYGLDISMEKIAEDLVGCEYFGTTLEDMKRLSEKYGFRTEVITGFKGGLITPYINADIPPVVLQMRDVNTRSPHYRVVSGYRRDGRIIVVHDPEFGEYIDLPYKLFDSLWINKTRAALLIYKNKDL